MAQQFDLIVVGAGMVGATLARAMADLPLRIALVDGMPLPRATNEPKTESGYDSRVSAISAASENILDNLGVWQRIPGASRSPYRYMRVWDAEGTGEIGFDADALGELRLGHIVENHLIQSALLESLAETGIALFGAQRVEGLVREPDGWRLLLEGGQALQAPLVVAADGAKSKLRELAGFEMREWDYLHNAIVTTIQTERPHQATAWQRFMPSGPLALLPLNDRGQVHYCSIVWSVVPEHAGRIMALDDEAFREELEQAFESRLGRILATDVRHRIPLRQRHAKRYVMPGLALIGDAAHSIHPLAGQGVNLGLLDAAELYDTLRAALQRGEGLGALAVLQRYERRRMGANLGMMAAMEGFERLFHADALPLRWARNAGMRLLDGQAMIKGGIMRRAMGLSGDLPSLALDGEIARPND
ncbi:2-octaprenyl-3-methyl-6-methoxy-1,4-benzoquinol hydroxylase [Halopseudomonas xinjiangensis]|uniref:2-octaprenyl-3-methyl-6-methoxy-1,4-benzoquinol hydroxylase n=1 Tax=Halopseudomonas xinjiangensis TaxID=487184 RepID=A0A1H1L9U3_9GAMM|nr:FAD-dependent monooxygenase [Halopseudomonas xinjiangensis]SDR71187.1 2-octaprenyl-3-methyl-6-methoxy-1,4-benzoquinol hydroxylase [Halopseudomonas xinjiangensis]